MSIFALNDNLKFIGCNIDFEGTKNLYLEGVLYKGCSIKADNITVAHVTRDYEYVREFLNNSFDFKNCDRNIYIHYNDASDNFVGTTFRFIENLSLNKNAKNFIDFNYGAPYKNCKMEIIGNIIAGNSSLSTIKNVVNNAVIINNIINYDSKFLNPINFTR